MDMNVAMDLEQQFCLRWNNHQRTLVSVFDTLLESGTLVDCTLAAEGQYLKAHKVVLSACSPYFELLLSQHCERHPIIILKDVTFKELKAMIDYMYRGEVNVSQDQLGDLLKAAESLQIKGLSDSGGCGTADEEGSGKHVGIVKPTACTGNSQVASTTEHEGPVPICPTKDESQPLQRGMSSREGSASPSPRKRKKHRRRSYCGDEGRESHALQDGHDHTSSSSERSHPVPNVPVKDEVDIKVRPALALPVLADGETVHSVESPEEVLLEPKSEYVEEDRVEDLTLDDGEDELDVTMDHSQAGPSHSREESNQSYAVWNIGDQSRDDLYLAAQEVVGSHRDTQETAVSWGYEESGPGDAHGFPCPTCGNVYRSRHSLYAHTSLVCGKEPRYSCPVCLYKSKIKGNLLRHVKTRHNIDTTIQALNKMCRL